MLVSNDLAIQLKELLNPLLPLGYRAKKHNNTIFFYNRGNLVAVLYGRTFRFYRIDDLLMIKLHTLLSKDFIYNVSLGRTGGVVKECKLMELLDIVETCNGIRKNPLKEGSFIIKTVV